MLTRPSHNEFLRKLLEDKSTHLLRGILEEKSLLDADRKKIEDTILGIQQQIDQFFRDNNLNDHKEQASVEQLRQPFTQKKAHSFQLLLENIQAQLNELYYSVPWSSTDKHKEVGNKLFTYEKNFRTEFNFHLNDILLKNTEKLAFIAKKFPEKIYDKAVFFDFDGVLYLNRDEQTVSTAPLTIPDAKFLRTALQVLNDLGIYCAPGSQRIVDFNNTLQMAKALDNAFGVNRNFFTLQRVLEMRTHLVGHDGKSKVPFLNVVKEFPEVQGIDSQNILHVDDSRHYEQTTTAAGYSFLFVDADARRNEYKEGSPEDRQYLADLFAKLFTFKDLNKIRQAFRDRAKENGTSREAEAFISQLKNTMIQKQNPPSYRQRLKFWYNGLSAGKKALVCVAATVAAIGIGIALVYGGVGALAAIGGVGVTVAAVAPTIVSVFVQLTTWAAALLGAFSTLTVAATPVIVDAALSETSTRKILKDLPEEKINSLSTPTFDQTLEPIATATPTPTPPSEEQPEVTEILESPLNSRVAGAK